MASLKYRNTWPKLRILALQRLIPGTPCRRCGKPMYHTQPLDLGHPTDGHDGIALEHRSCNRRAGGINGNRSPLRKGKPDNRKPKRSAGRQW